MSEIMEDELNPFDGNNILVQVINASTSAIVITDNTVHDNPIIFCNRAFETLTGFECREVIGRNCRFLQKEDREQDGRYIIKQAINEGANCVTKIKNYKKDGTPFWNEMHVHPVKNEDGDIINFIGFQNDLSLQHELEELLKSNRKTFERAPGDRMKELVESEGFLKSIFETIRESLLILDPELRVVSVNRFFLKTFQVTAEETVGKYLFELGNGQWNIKRLRDLLLELLPTHNPVIDFEVEHTFPRIGKKVMVLNANQVEFQSDYKDLILLAIEDITLKREIDNRKDDFLSIASHELRSPLTTVIGYIQLLNAAFSNNGEEVKQTIQKCNDSLQKISNLITDMLDAAVIRSGNIEIRKSFFDFDAMVTTVIDAIQKTTDSHKIVINGSASRHFCGDEKKLKQVVTHLVSNAVKYSPDSREVIVNLSLVSGYIKFSIRDYGLGINQDEHEKIFDRFYRVQSIQKKFPGIGIGLFVSKEIIESHQGSLWVESEEKQGSTFNFTLPINS